MHSLLLSLLLATTGIDAGVAPTAACNAGQSTSAPSGAPLYVLGSSINLRKEPSAHAEVLEKLSIGTECHASEPVQGEWRKVCCGGKQGFVSASLVGPEKPSADTYRAEAQDAQRPLAQRLESALRAATLAHEDAALSTLLGELFYQRQLELAAADKPPKQKQTFRRRCHLTDETTCLKETAEHLLKDVGTDALLKNGLFALAVGNLDGITVYRGRYRTQKDVSLPDSVTLTYDVLAQEHFTPTRVLQESLFTTCGEKSPCRKAVGSTSFGQFILDDASQALLRAIPQQWARLELDPNAEGRFEGPWLEILWNCPEKKPLSLQFEPDIHGRWRLDIPLESPAWVSAVAKAPEGLTLTLERVSEDSAGRPSWSTKQVLFKLPPLGEDVAYLGDVPYTTNLRRFSKKPYYPCR